MDPYGVPSRRSHHGQWGGTRGGGLTPAGHGPSRSGGGTSLAVRVAIPSGLMITVTLSLVKGVWGWSPSPISIVGASVVAVAMIIAYVLYAGLRQPPAVAE